MNKRITFRGMEHTPVLEEYCNNQLVKIVDFLVDRPGPISIDMVLDAVKSHAHHKAELRIKTQEFDLVTHHEGPDMYAVIDDVADTMLRNLHEKKRQLVDEKKRGSGHRGL